MNNTYPNETQKFDNNIGSFRIHFLTLEVKRMLND